MAVMTFWKGHWLAEHVFSRCFVFNLEEREIAWSFRKIQRPLSLGKSLFRKTIFFPIICNERLFSISLRRRYLFEKFEQRFSYVQISSRPLLFILPLLRKIPRKSPKIWSRFGKSIWMTISFDDTFEKFEKAHRGVIFREKINDWWKKKIKVFFIVCNSW